MFICERCIDLADEVLAEDEERSNRWTSLAPERDPEARCNFCGKERGEGGVQLVAGAGVYICSECVRVAYEILRGHNPPAPAGT